MGWFTKKEIKKEESSPKLPDLPMLPELPNLDDNFSQKQIHQLPSFPASPTGDKFSQTTIKNAVTGKKEERGDLADDFAEGIEEMQMMERTPRKIIRRELAFPEERNIPRQFEEAVQRVKKVEPVFIRLDKFEDSINILDKAKRQVLEIEKTLREIQKVKEEEEKELTFWENEIQSVKAKIEKIEKDIFSRVE